MGLLCPWLRGQTLSVCAWSCVCSAGGGNSVSSVFHRSGIHVLLPVPSLAFDSVSSCWRLTGDWGIWFLTASSRGALRSVSSVAWVLWPNPAQLCQKLGSSVFKPLGPATLPFQLAVHLHCVYCEYAESPFSQGQRYGLMLSAAQGCWVPDPCSGDRC